MNYCAYEQDKLIAELKELRKKYDKLFVKYKDRGIMIKDLERNLDMWDCREIL
jgi:hypothetical protein